MRKGKKNRNGISITAICFLCVLLATVLYIGEMREAEQSKQYAELQKEGAKLREEEARDSVISVSGGDPILLDKMHDAEILVSPNEFEESAVIEPFGKTISFTLSSSASADNTVLFCFDAHANEECNLIRVDIYSTQNQRIESVYHYVQTQTSRYYVPVEVGDGIERFEISIKDGNGGVNLYNATLVDCQKNEIPSEYYGVFNISPSVENISIEDIEGIGITNAQDIICDDGYLYIGTIDKLYVASLENLSKPLLLCEINGLGTIRRLAVANDGNVLVVASREYGVFLIDITNASEACIVGHIDTLELASGVDVVGNHLFIASRYYGIEIYDITDPSAPEFCSTAISSQVSERIDCKVYGDYLYAGVWATQMIEVFDISDVSRPVYVGCIETDGNVYGLDAYNGNLVVATGFHSTLNDSTDADSSGYATGNGLSIYDLSNPKKPTLRATVKSDGRYYYIGSDYWNVRVSEGIAYFSDLYNGMYIYDITQPDNPVRLAKITIPIGVDEAGYVDLSSPENIFSYDATQFVQSPITGVAISDGYIYVANVYSDVKVLEFQFAKQIDKEQTQLKCSGEAWYSETDYDDGRLEVEHYSFPGQSFAIAEDEEYLYVGTSRGIAVCNHDMQQLAFFETEYAVRDIKLVNGRLYTAEGIGGVSVYEAAGDLVTRLANFVPSEESRANVCTQIGVSPFGDYAIISCRLNLMAILNVQDLNNIYVAEYLKTGAVYYRNICSGWVGNTVYVSHAQGVSEIVFDGLGGYTYNEFTNNNYYYSSAGFAALDDRRFVAIHNRGYQVLDVSDGFANVKETELCVLRTNLYLKGSPAVGNDVMCITYPAGKQITVIDISAVDVPTILGNIYVQGTPDTALVSTNGSIYVPCRYEGVLKITIKEK